MVIEQIVRRGVTGRSLLTAMEEIPRHRFVLPDDLAWAYGDGPLPIGQGQTISQPYIVALMTELLHLEPTAHVLEIGSGSGYQAAVLGKLASEVHTMELIPELSRRAEEILRDLGYVNVHVHLGDGSMGWPEHAPYDGIIVTAAGPRVPPPLLEQLAEGGRLVLPVGGLGFQLLEVHQRVGGRITREQNNPVVFVPLRGEYGWR
jgi:protein-L-isoaspartate(D-aspartate) O-methyltransferase